MEKNYHQFGINFRPLVDTTTHLIPGSDSIAFVENTKNFVDLI